jgi:hypothetical protein
MTVGMTLQQAINLGLVFTSYDYRYDLSTCYKFMDGLTKIFVCRSSLSAGHDSRADIIAIYDDRNDLSTGRDCTVGSYNKL